VNPLLIVDCTDADSLPPGMLKAAASRIKDSRALVLATSRSGSVPDPILAVADLTLIERVPGRPSHGRGVVEVDSLDVSLETMTTAVTNNPTAALSLGWLLRAHESLGAAEALACESALYSTLLAGAEFAKWLAGRPARRAPDVGESVRVRRTGDVLHLSLARPARRNAMDAAMRNRLVEALEIALWEPSLAVVLDGDGPSFCAGGDLDEFGTARDPAAAHLIRVLASPAALVVRLAGRTTAYLHGTCVGAGIEIPAFAGRVVADPHTTFRLPEIAMGLIPGAGGTVSLPARIGRQRVLWMALTGAEIDADTALEWGLVDEVSIRAG
jgi:hypothetical protein